MSVPTQRGSQSPQAIIRRVIVYLQAAGRSRKELLLIKQRLEQASLDELLALDQRLTDIIIGHGNRLTVRGRDGSTVNLVDVMTAAPSRRA